MDGARQELLAHARLAVDQDGGVQVHHRARQLEDRLHPGAPGQDVAEREPLLVAAEGPPVGGLQLLELDGAADDEK